MMKVIVFTSTELTTDGFRYRIAAVSRHGDCDWMTIVEVFKDVNQKRVAGVPKMRRTGKICGSYLKMVKVIEYKVTPSPY